MITLDATATSHPNRLGGAVCFVNTRVPVNSLFDCMAEGYTLDRFLDSFPTVNKEQALAALTYAYRYLEIAVKEQARIAWMFESLDEECANPRLRAGSQLRCV